MKELKTKQNNKKDHLLGTLPGIGNITCYYIKKSIGRKRSNKSKWRSSKSRTKLLMPPHPLTNLQIQKCYQSNSEFNDVYSRNNLSKIKDETYINLDEYESIGTHGIALYVNVENVTYFDSFEVEHTPKQIRKLIAKESKRRNNYRKQAFNSIMCQYVSIGFINFMLKGESLSECINSFSPKEYNKNNKIIFKSFS